MYQFVQNESTMACCGRPVAQGPCSCKGLQQQPNQPNYAGMGPGPRIRNEGIEPLGLPPSMFEDNAPLPLQRTRVRADNRAEQPKAETTPIVNGYAPDPKSGIEPLGLPNWDFS